MIPLSRAIPPEVRNSSEAVFRGRWCLSARRFTALAPLSFYSGSSAGVVEEEVIDEERRHGRLREMSPSSDSTRNWKKKFASRAWGRTAGWKTRFWMKNLKTVPWLRGAGGRVPDGAAAGRRWKRFRRKRSWKPTAGGEWRASTLKSRTRTGAAAHTAAHRVRPAAQRTPWHNSGGPVSPREKARRL